MNLRVWFLAAVVAVAQPVGAAQPAPEIAATPNRPGVADPADTTQKGVLEMEFGWERAFRSADFKSATAFSTLFRFGLLEDFELRLGLDNYLTQRVAGSGRHSGYGDTSVGAKYRLLKEEDWPTLAFGYDVKIPTASRRKGLGSGRVDHNLYFLSQKELWDIDWALTYILSLVGKERRKSFDDGHTLALAFSRNIYGPVGLGGEFYGGPRLNRDSPAVARTQWSLTYTVAPRLIFDAGVDIGLRKSDPDVTYFAGVTVALADLYRLFGMTK